MPVSVILRTRASCCLLLQPWCCPSDCCGLTDSSVLPHIPQRFKRNPQLSFQASEDLHCAPGVRAQRNKMQICA
uniref:Uncharacterized protein n=1 Tax=Rhipicephalus pulchellus TaxID=72859 RepID=L7LVI0_RHIPC